MVPGKLITPLTTSPPPPPPATTALGQSEIMNHMKLKVLPNPDSTALAGCDKNSDTRVLATAVYSKLEHHFFDDTLSHMDITSAFRCNVSQLSKAITRVDYASGLHNYKPKEKKTPTKRASDEPDPDPEQAKKSDTAHPTTSQLQAMEKQDKIILEDTLSSSSDSDLPSSLNPDGLIYKNQILLNFPCNN